jgi:hypothetical protein
VRELAKRATTSAHRYATDYPHKTVKTHHLEHILISEDIFGSSILILEGNAAK